MASVVAFDNNNYNNIDDDDNNSVMSDASTAAMTSSNLIEFSRTFSGYHGYVSVVICVLGVFSNFFTIIVLTRRHMLNSTNIILTALAVSDMLKMMSYIPFALQFYCLYGTAPSKGRNSLGWIRFQLFHVHFAVTAHTISIWLVVLLSVSRYCYVSMRSTCLGSADSGAGSAPGRGNRLAAEERLRAATYRILAIYVLSAVFLVPTYFTIGIRPCSSFCPVTGASHSPREGGPGGHALLFNDPGTRVAINNKNNVDSSGNNDNHYHRGSRYKRDVDTDYDEDDDGSSNRYDNNKSVSNHYYYNYYYYNKTSKHDISNNNNRTFRRLVRDIYQRNVRQIRDDLQNDGVDVTANSTSPSADVIVCNNQCDYQGLPMPRRVDDNGEAPVILYELYSVTDTANYLLIQRLNFWIHALVIKMIPCCLMSIFGTLIVCSVRASHRRFQRLRRGSLRTAGVGATDSQRERDHYRTTAMLVVVIILFLVTELPQGILALLSGVWTEYFHTVYTPLGDLMDIVALVNNGINFTLYCAMSKDFRQTFLKLFYPTSAPGPTTLSDGVVGMKNGVGRGGSVRRQEKV